VATIAVTALISAGIGGGIVAAVNHTTSPTQAAPAAPPAPTAKQVHADNVRLCTLWATYNSAMPDPPKTAMDVLPTLNGLRWALAESPNASPEIRDALRALVDQYDASIASTGTVRTRGYAAPPPYSLEKFHAVYDRAWDACQLGS
jgi:hypothetical protein